MNSTGYDCWADLQFVKPYALNVRFTGTADDEDEAKEFVASMAKFVEEALGPAMGKMSDRHEALLLLQGVASEFRPKGIRVMCWDVDPTG